MYHYTVPCLVLVIYATGSFAQHAQFTPNVYGGLQAGSSGGTLATLGTNHNVFRTDNGHQLDARAQVSKHFQPSGPTQYGAGLDYTAPKAGASVDVTHAHRMGTGISTSGHANIFESRDHRTRLDATANYGQHFAPRTQPDIGAGLRFTHKF